MGDNVADIIEATTACTTGDLFEVANREDFCAGAIILAELSEQHRADRHVDAHAQGVGATDHLEQPALGELFYQNSVFGKEACMVNANAVT